MAQPWEVAFYNLIWLIGNDNAIIGSHMITKITISTRCQQKGNTMIDEEQIKQIINSRLNEMEKTGKNAAVSGHLGFKSIIIDGIGKPELQKRDTSDRYQLTCNYRVIVETEFTYYPDNLPQEYPKKARFIMNDKGEIIDEKIL